MLGEAAGQPLLDERVSIHEGDVIDLVRQPPFPWDAILLDVDNGPTSLALASNGWLYGWQGLEAGVLGVWSAAPDSAFTRRLERTGFDIELTTVHGPEEPAKAVDMWCGSPFEDCQS